MQNLSRFLRLNSTCKLLRLKIGFGQGRLEHGANFPIDAFYRGLAQNGTVERLEITLQVRHNYEQGDPLKKDEIVQKV